MEKERSTAEEIKDWVVSIVIAVALAMFIRTFIVELYVVDGPSMRPTATPHDRSCRPPERRRLPPSDCCASQRFRVHGCI